MASTLDPKRAIKATQLTERTEEQLAYLVFNSNSALPISSGPDMGVELRHDQLIKVGATVARLYSDKHHAQPPKRQLQWGEDRRINAYTEKHGDLIAAEMGRLQCK